MTREDIKQAYFEWMCDLVGSDRYRADVSYERLLRFLHDTEFVYFIPKDENRAEDGIELRYRFALYARCAEFEYCLGGPCSVLEMMVALAMRCEENIMDDPNIGNRTGQWFWGMIANLGLGSMFDSRFNRQYVEDTVARFLNREYAPNGKGGLFTVRHCDRDLRTVEIWYQLCWYLDSIV